jgi:hypothetical protein
MGGKMKTIHKLGEFITAMERCSCALTELNKCQEELMDTWDALPDWLKEKYGVQVLKLLPTGEVVVGVGNTG